ncbi:MAG: hypothetical protein L0Z46_07770 [Nitrospiraceae bacterium]|nr:hypothetical protein [Nitrospiraceae bacterium]
MNAPFTSLALAAILAGSWEPGMAGDARLLLNLSPDSLGDNGLPKG